jgi:tetratricopeptide (TPR) repeat protein
MKKILIALALFVAPFVVEAQVKTPQSSPKAILKQTVGLTEVEINYSRPSARGRNIFGDLVPFGKLWRTGANENTTISFSDDVVIDGKTLKKGKYSIYSIPKIENWEVIFYKTTDNWGLPQEWNEANVALRANAKENVLSNPVETFTIEIGSLDNNFAFLELFWGNSHVALKFDVPTQKLATESIEKVLAGPTSADYFSAAQYLYQSNGDNAKALVYVNKALEMSSDKPFWYNRQKSLIQAKLGDKQGAIESAKLSLEAAELAKNQDYVKMNKDSIAEWSKK